MGKRDSFQTLSFGDDSISILRVLVSKRVGMLLHSSVTAYAVPLLIKCGFAVFSVFG